MSSELKEASSKGFDFENLPERESTERKEHGENKRDTKFCFIRHPLGSGLVWGTPSDFKAKATDGFACQLFVAQYQDEGGGPRLLFERCKVKCLGPRRPRY
jgi:hypothetical protein